MDMAAHHDHLRSEGLLTSYDRCPVCASPDRKETSRRYEDDRYMKALGSILQLGPGGLEQLLRIYECGNCATVYGDPWLSVKAMTKLYGSEHAQHELGWRNFYGWVQRPANSPSYARWQRLWSLLTGVAGDVKVYGELTCPFVGLLFYFRDRELKGLDKIEHVTDCFARLQGGNLHPNNRRRLVNRAGRKLIKLGKAVGWPVREPDRQFGNVNRASRHAIRQALRYPGYRPTRGGGDDASPATSAAAPLPHERYLVFQSSPCIWSMSCNSMNGSCRALCTTALNTPVLDLDAVRREGIRFDVFAMANSLDHFLNPREMLAKALEVSRLVYIDVHDSYDESTFSRQHLYVFGKKFLEAIRDESWSYADITHMGLRPGQCAYLVSREIDLASLDLDRLAAG